MLHFGIADEEAWGVGLACGGAIDVFIEPLLLSSHSEPRPERSRRGSEESGSHKTETLSEAKGDTGGTETLRFAQGDIYETLKQCLVEDQPAALATVIRAPEGIGRKLLVSDDGRRQGALGHPRLDEQVARDALRLLHTETPQTCSYPIDGLAEPVEVFVDVYPASPKLIIVGAVHIALPLVKFAKELGFRTAVIDARSVFATPERFAHADELIITWPEEALAQLHIDTATYIVVLTHDEKLDDPALKVALASPARYVGALGSRKTHARRVTRLKAEGITNGQLARLHAPIGLEIGARSPEEIAISIIGQIVAARHGVI